MVIFSTDNGKGTGQYQKMIKLNPIIERINALVDEDTEQSITYAALEARLALEKVCYDRLRQRHDYISHSQLLRWQPGAIVKTLINDVDRHVTKSMTLKMSKGPAIEGVRPEDDDFIEIGTEVGFDPKRITKLWNAIARLGLHVRLPENKDDHIPDYGDKEPLKAKVVEVVEELKRLSKTTLTISGIGEEIHFVCSCGEKNRRRAELLNEGHHVHCINPECKETWKVIKEQDTFAFESVTIGVNCEKCGEGNFLPQRLFLDMKNDEVGRFSCINCKHKNYVQWKLTQVRPADK